MLRRTVENEKDQDQYFGIYSLQSMATLHWAQPILSFIIVIEICIAMISQAKRIIKKQNVQTNLNINVAWEKFHT